MFLLFWKPRIIWIGCLRETQFKISHSVACERELTSMLRANLVFCLMKPIPRNLRSELES